MSPNATGDLCGPPWYVRRPDGSLNVSAIPKRLEEHPEIKQRGLVLTTPEKPGVVYSTNHMQDPQWVVKILDLDTEERAVYERLLRDKDAVNHTVPGELTELGHPLLIMPRLASYHHLSPSEFSTWPTLGFFLQLVEGVEYLHSLNIAHMDLCYGNMLVATEYDAEDHPTLLHAYRLYIIDFDSARMLIDGPGVQCAIKLPPTQTPPPPGVESFDPYSWDVYCVGRTMEYMMQFHDSKALPWFMRWYARWLVGEERVGCTGIYRCRPTARKARLVLSAVRSVMYVLQLGVPLSLFATRALSSLRR